MALIPSSGAWPRGPRNAFVRIVARSAAPKSGITGVYSSFTDVIRNTIHNYRTFQRQKNSSVSLRWFGDGDRYMINLIHGLKWNLQMYLSRQCWLTLSENHSIVDPVYAYCFTSRLVVLSKLSLIISNRRRIIIVTHESRIFSTTETSLFFIVESSVAELLESLKLPNLRSYYENINEKKMQKPTILRR